MTTTEEVIRCEGLTKRYPPNLTAVDNLGLSILCGEIFGMLGPNGAGKTTTIGMITTLVVPTAGRASVAGIDVVAHSSLAKQLIGVVSQNNTLDRALNVWENLYYHGRLFGMSARDSREAADKALTEFRLREKAKTDVNELSGGMARRLQVARALIHSPSVLFLDEPTAGLDPQSRIALWEILGRLHDEGQTIMLTTHNMQEAESVCDRVAIMDHGRVLAMDTPDNLKRSIGADSIVTISADTNLKALQEYLADKVEGLTRSRQVDGTVQLQVKRSLGILPKLVDAAEAGGFSLTDISVREPSLETVFINLTGKELRE